MTNTVLPATVGESEERISRFDVVVDVGQSQHLLVIAKDGLTNQLSIAVWWLDVLGLIMAVVNFIGRVDHDTARERSWGAFAAWSCTRLES